MNYPGIDVAKGPLDGCLLLEDTRRKTKSVSHSAEGLVRLRAGCQAGGGRQISIAHPARVRRFAEAQGLLSKNDALDAFAIARRGQTTVLRLWPPPTPEGDPLHALIARRDAVAQDWQRERKRKEKADAGPAPALILKSIEHPLPFLEQALKDRDDDTDRLIRETPALKEDRTPLESILKSRKNISMQEV
jgi:transposase